MNLTQSEMDLQNLEYSFGYGAAIIGECVIFTVNSNVNDEQHEALTKEIIRRCTCHDDLLAACEAALEYLNLSSKLDWDNILTPQLEAAIAKASEK